MTLSSKHNLNWIPNPTSCTFTLHTITLVYFPCRNIYYQEGFFFLHCDKFDLRDFLFFLFTNLFLFLTKVIWVEMHQAFLHFRLNENSLCRGKEDVDIIPPSSSLCIPMSPDNQVPLLQTSHFILCRNNFLLYALCDFGCVFIFIFIFYVSHRHKQQLTVNKLEKKCHNVISAINCVIIDNSDNSFILGPVLPSRQLASAASSTYRMWTLQIVQ